MNVFRSVAYVGFTLPWHKNRISSLHCLAQDAVPSLDITVRSNILLDVSVRSNILTSVVLNPVLQADSEASLEFKFA
jgi:hypothetical protein